MTLKLNLESLDSLGPPGPKNVVQLLCISIISYASYITDIFHGVRTDIFLQIERHMHLLNTTTNLIKGKKVQKLKKDVSLNMIKYAQINQKNCPMQQKSIIKIRDFLLVGILRNLTSDGAGRFSWI